MTALRFPSLSVDFAAKGGQAKLLRQESSRMRLHNIRAFANLERPVELAFGVRERRVLLHVTARGEELYIQYPGKESVVSSARAVRLGLKPEDMARPWDFRPKLRRSDGVLLDDLSFKDIWDDLITALAHDVDPATLRILATVFFRMALLIGYQRTSERCAYTTVDGRRPDATTGLAVEFDWYKLRLPGEVVDYLAGSIPTLRGVSVEAYLLYNDLIAQNEDCKYYYRDVIVRKADWNSKIGRHNTMLSHVSLLEYLEGLISFSGLVDRFVKGRGVAPIPNRSLPTVTRGLVKC